MLDPKCRIKQQRRTEYRVSRIGRNRQLRHEKDFPGVRVFHFGSGGKSLYIDIFTRRKWALDQMRLPGNGSTVRKITLYHLRGSGGRSGRGRLFAGSCGSSFRGRRIGVERLLSGDLPLGRTRISGRRAPTLSRLIFIIGAAEKKQRAANKRQRHRKLHRVSSSTTLHGF